MTQPAPADPSAAALEVALRRFLATQTVPAYLRTAAQSWLDRPPPRPLFPGF